MYRLLLGDIFGVNAVQDLSTITITKSDLPNLTPSLSNRAEQLLTAICVQALSNFQGEIVTGDGESIDVGDTRLSFDNSEAFELLKIFLWKPFFSAVSSTEFLEIKQIVVQRFEVSGYEYED